MKARNYDMEMKQKFNMFLRVSKKVNKNKKTIEWGSEKSQSSSVNRKNNYKESNDSDISSQVEIKFIYTEVNWI